MNSIQELLGLTPQSILNFQDFFFALLGSLLASIICLLLYRVSYSRNHIGVGVQRMFLLGGPSITALLLAIQFSLPLSLGLLGALSIVRFRTPVKDPEEIGFILLLIAGAIGCATLNYWLVIILYIISTIMMIFQNYFKFFSLSLDKGFIIISIENVEAIEKTEEITKYMEEKLSGVKLETISTLNEQANLHYKFNKNKNINWGEFNKGINILLKPFKVEIHIS